MSQYRRAVRDQTLHFIYTLNDGSGGAIDPSDAFEAGDFRIYKDGSATQRSSTAGFTVANTFDTVTGLGQFSVDLSDNSDAGFYEVGSTYEILLVPDTETVDAQTVVAKIGSFRIVDGAEFYPDGFVHVDTVNGAAGTVVGANGTPGNPVDSLADARTICEALGLRAVLVAPNSSVTAAASFAGYRITGEDYTLALGGQSFDNATVSGATVSGTFSGTANFRGCLVGAITGPSANITRSGLTGTITANGAGDWYLADCWQQGSATFNFGAAVANTNLRVLRYAGGFSLSNCGQAGTDAFTFSGVGALTINSNCTGGSGEIQGVVALTDNGAVTLTQAAQMVPDTVFSRTSAEPTGVPVLGTDDMAAILEWVAMLNLTTVQQSSSNLTVRDISDASDIATAPYSNNGTVAERGAFS